MIVDLGEPLNVPSDDVDIWQGMPSIEGLVPFEVRAVAFRTQHISQVDIERRAGDMLGAAMAVLPPVRKWRVEPTIDSFGDFNTGLYRATARARGWF